MGLRVIEALEVPTVLSFNNLGDGHALTFPVDTLVGRRSKPLNPDRPVETLHLGTCTKPAMEMAECPIDFDDLKIILEQKFGIKVVPGTHSY